MKLKYTLAAFAALTVGANAAISFHNLAVSGGVGNQSGNTGEVNITFTTGTLGLDTDLTSVDLSGPNTGAQAGLFYLELSLDADNDATTQGVTGGVIAQSGGSAMVVNVINNFSFAGATLADNTVYNLRFVDVGGAAITGVRLGLSTGDNDQGTEMFENGNVARYDGAFDAPITVNFTAPVPEPSSTALLGLGGLALILRRRK